MHPPPPKKNPKNLLSTSMENLILRFNYRCLIKTISSIMHRYIDKTFCLLMIIMAMFWESYLLPCDHDQISSKTDDEFLVKC